MVVPASMPTLGAGNKGNQKHVLVGRRDFEQLVSLIAQGRVARNIAFACARRTDGAGGQGMAIVACMALARYSGCRYLHAPFVTMAHALGAPEDWALRWERFLNFGDGEATVPADAEPITLEELVHHPEAYQDRPVVVAQRMFYLPRKPLAPVLDALRSDLRTRYQRSDKSGMTLHRGPPGSTIVAVHLRRGDVTEASVSHRYVPEKTALNTILRLRKAVAPLGRPLHINLYSQGAKEQFQAFADIGCHLRIDVDPFETFHNLVAADILLMGKSKFSRLAGLLSDGIVVTAERRAYWLSNWQRRRKNDQLSMRRLQSALLADAGWLERTAFQARCWWDRRMS